MQTEDWDLGCTMLGAFGSQRIPRVAHATPPLAFVVGLGLMLTLVLPLLSDGIKSGVGRQRKSLPKTVCAAAPEVEPYTPPPPPPFNPSKQVGALAPLGFFDPLGFSKTGDKEGFNNLRAAEIKHGRVAMMAALGAVVQHLVKFPGFEKVPAGLSAVTSAPGTYGFIALLALGAGFELVIWKQDPKKEPGNFGNPVGWGSYDDDMRNKEINNGRFAMFAALGIIAADLLTGKDALQQLGA
jgi:hypothetical protein